MERSLPLSLSSHRAFFSASQQSAGHRIGSGLASILNATTPLFTVILAHWLTRDEPMTPARLVGVVCGLLGVVVIIGSGALEQLGFEVLAQVAVLGLALLSAAVAYIIYFRILARAGATNILLVTHVRSAGGGTPNDNRRSGGQASPNR